MHARPQERQHIRFSTVFVVLVLATIGFIVFWQLVLEGSLARPTPAQVVTEFLRLGLPNPDGFEVLETFPPREFPGRNKAAVIRIRYRARDEQGQLAAYDKAFFLVGEDVTSMLDWTPEVEAKIAELLEQAVKKAKGPSTTPPTGSGH